MVRKSSLIIGFLLLFISISYMFYNSYKITKESVIEEQKVKEFINDGNKIEKEAHIEQNNYNSINYSFMIEIPSISLKKGFYDMNSKYNNVKYGIEILKSQLPDQEHGNFILASHNGNSRISYFKNLDKLNIGDYIYIYYDHTTYIYQLHNYYEEEKTGKIDIKRDTDKNTLTLITCKKNTDDKQMIYVSYLVDQEKY